ncbi:hypothetical protein [Actinomadura sp. GTD37]|uniref:hypothetical protein n=1 Tax=Actinomadura sp. GTD37 TaxID=1778030 RepID=UPI0035BEC176
MSTSDRLTKRARTRCIFTGEPFAYAKHAVQRCSPRRPIPAATNSQAVIESQIMKHLCKGGEWWAHPVGVQRVVINSDRIELVLDDHTVTAGGRQHFMSTYVADHLLPFAEADGQVIGPIGLRVAAIASSDLHLKIVGTDSRVVLRASKGTDWRQLLAERYLLCRTEGLIPLWQEASLTVYEKRDLSTYSHLRDEDRKLSWIGSGILRRIALLYTSSTAYSTRSWIADGQWKFELDTSYLVPLDHDSLIERLTDPRWGPGFVVSRHHCSCHLASLRDPSHDLTCTYYLGNVKAPNLGKMQIRFRSMARGYEDGIRQELEKVDGDSKWLERVLPKCDGMDSRSSDR